MPSYQQHVTTLLSTYANTFTSRRLYPAAGDLIKGITGEVVCVRQKPDLADLEKKLKVGHTCLPGKKQWCGAHYESICYVEVPATDMTRTLQGRTLEK